MKTAPESQQAAQQAPHASRHAVARAEAAAAACADLQQIYLRERFEDARSDADAIDHLLAQGFHLPLAGLTMAVKACVDVKGWVTDAASAVLAHEAPANADAPLVTALRSHGATVVAHSNMTEFAFGALGVNATTGTPRTPLDPAGERVAGGSTSGGVVAVARGLADFALGTDTSGSVRIPAAFCGLVGFKPSRGVLSMQGVIPLSTTFDVPGFITRDMETLTRITDALALYPRAESALRPRLTSLRGVRFAVPAGFAREACDPVIAAAFEHALGQLSDGGATIVETHFSDLREPSRVAIESGIIVAEAYAWHRKLLQERAARYDQRVGPRIQQGQSVPAARYIEGLKTLCELARQFDSESESFDAVLTPTVPIQPPRMADLTRMEDYLRLNALSFSLTELANRTDVPSLALPFARASRRPYGLMLTGRRQADAHLLEVARVVEAALGPTPEHTHQ